MAEHSGTRPHDQHLEEEHYAPARTTPQGTQAYGVEHGHEEQDITVRPLWGWAIGLVTLTLVSYIVTWAIYATLFAQAEKREERMRPAFSTVKREPPLPRVLPNPIDSPAVPHERVLAPFTPLEGPAEFAAIETADEDKKLEQYGLIDPETKLPRLPEKVLQAAEATGAPVQGRKSASPVYEAVPGVWPEEELLRQLAPSDASGGLLQENRLR